MNRKLRDRLRIGLLLGVFAAVSGVWLVQAQQTTFTGTSFRIEAEGNPACRRGASRRAPARTGTRTASSCCSSRKAGCATRSRASRWPRVGLNETAHLPRGVRHWHGAVPDEPLTHVSVTFPNEAGEHLTIQWLEPVTDDVYESGAGQ